MSYPKMHHQLPPLHNNIQTSITQAALLLNMLIPLIHSSHHDTFNVFCGSYIDVIPTHPQFKYIPYFVKLHRCQGKDIIDGNPTIRDCVPTKETPIVYAVELSDFSGDSLLNITLYNHTACEYRCKTDKTLCGRGMEWHEPTCSCCVGNRSNCAPGYVWSSTQCMCVPEISQMTFPTVPTSPKGSEPNVSALFDDTPCVKYQLVIVIAVAEFVVVIMVCIFIFYGICKRSEVVYNLSAKHRAHRVNQQTSVFTNQTSNSTDISLPENGLYSNRNSAEIPGDVSSSNSNASRSQIGSVGSKGSFKKEDAIYEEVGEKNDVVINGTAGPDNQVYYVKKNT